MPQNVRDELSRLRHATDDSPTRGQAREAQRFLAWRGQVQQLHDQKCRHQGRDPGVSRLRMQGREEQDRRLMPQTGERQRTAEDLLRWVYGDLPEAACAALGVSVEVTP